MEDSLAIGKKQTRFHMVKNCGGHSTDCAPSLFKKESESRRQCYRAPRKACGTIKNVAQRRESCRHRRGHRECGHQLAHCGEGDPADYKRWLGKISFQVVGRTRRCMARSRFFKRQSPLQTHRWCGNRKQTQTIRQCPLILGNIIGKKKKTARTVDSNLQRWTGTNF